MGQAPASHSGHPLPIQGPGQQCPLTQPCLGCSVPVQSPDCPSPQTEEAVTVSDQGGESEFTCTQDLALGWPL